VDKRRVEDRGYFCSAGSTVVTGAGVSNLTGVGRVVARGLGNATWRERYFRKAGFELLLSET